MRPLVFTLLAGFLLFSLSGYGQPIEYVSGEKTTTFTEVSFRNGRFYTIETKECDPTLIAWDTTGQKLWATPLKEEDWLYMDIKGMYVDSAGFITVGGGIPFSNFGSFEGDFYIARFDSTGTMVASDILPQEILEPDYYYSQEAHFHIGIYQRQGGGYLGYQGDQLYLFSQDMTLTHAGPIPDDHIKEIAGPVDGNYGVLTFQQSLWLLTFENDNPQWAELAVVVPTARSIVSVGERFYLLRNDGITQVDLQGNTVEISFPEPLSEVYRIRVQGDSMLLLSGRSSFDGINGVWAWTEAGGWETLFLQADDTRPSGLIPFYTGSHLWLFGKLSATLAENYYEHTSYFRRYRLDLDEPDDDDIEITGVVPVHYDVIVHPPNEDTQTRRVIMTVSSNVTVKNNGPDTLRRFTLGNEQVIYFFPDPVCEATFFYEVYHGQTIPPGEETTKSAEAIFVRDYPLNNFPDTFAAEDRYFVVGPNQRIDDNLDNNDWTYYALSALTSTKEPPPGELVLSPNPSSGTLRLQTPGHWPARARLRLYDAVGRLQFEQALQGEQLIQVNLQAGVYLAELQNETGERWVARVVMGE